MEKKLYDNCVEILKEELIAAMGCTEPIAIAFVSALARKTLGSEPVSCEVLCSGNIVKNVMGVVVPNSQGQRGIAVAAVLGIVGGDSDRELEVLQSVTPEDVEKARKLIAEGFCTCQLAKGVENLFVEVHLKDAEGHTVTAQIKDHHNNVTLLQKDDTVLVSAKQDSSANAKKGDRSLLTIKGILEFADEVRMEDVKELLDRQIQMNSAISQEGLKNPYGAEVGRVLLQHGNDLRTRARAAAAAGSDARMGGCALPVVINSGSGNQGITATMPVVAAAHWLDIDEPTMLRAVTLSNLIAIRIKSKFGRLSNLCGATVAGTGAACGITYLLGGGYHEICCAIQNMVGNVTGMVCDGAKADCALKISTCVNAACQAAAMGTRGVRVQSTDGIVEENVERTLDNFAILSTHGTSDSVILDLMLNKEHAPDAE